MDRLIQTHRKAGLGLDTNVGLLWVVGNLDVKLIARHKRLADRFDAGDFALLREFVGRFDVVATTASILTETGNLLPSLGVANRSLMAKFADMMQSWREEALVSAELARHHWFPELGLADLTVRSLAERGCLVLTDDAPLYHRLVGSGLACVNFNHLRSA